MIRIATCLLVSLLASTAHAEVAFERWFKVYLMGQPAGHAVIRREKTDDQIISAQEMNLQVRRGPATVRLDQSSRFTETPGGEAISATTRIKMAHGVIETHAEFGDDALTVTTRQGERKSIAEHPLPDERWLPPAAADRYVRQEIEKGAREIEYRTLDPQIAVRPYTMRVEVLGETTVQLVGKDVPAIERRTEMDALPGVVITDYVDDAGRPLVSSMHMGGMKVRLVAGDKAVAQARLTPPELLASLLVPAEPAIENPRRLDRGKYRLHVAEGEMPDLPRTSRQNVQVVDDRTAIVTVDVAGGFNPADDRPVVAHSTMIDGRDRRIAALADEAAANVAGGPAAQAEAMRRFVFEYIHAKGLGVGMATASEAVRTRRGDCTEHAMLLGAMLRAREIPSRVASGLVYADQFLNRRSVFGYHMWTQAWIDGQWVDLDAAISPDRAFDATHIALSVSDMADGEMFNDMIRFVPLVGRLKVTALAP